MVPPFDDAEAAAISLISCADDLGAWLLVDCHLRRVLGCGLATVRR